MRRTKSAALYKRPRYHAPASFLGQVLANIRRTIRTSDQILIHNGTGAAIIFPDDDREGGLNILERVYHSINLLQSETVIPPLKRETDILIGLGSYPKAGSSLESLLYHTGLVARRLRFRPAVTPLVWSIKSTGTSEEILHGRLSDADEQALLNQARSSGIPFMQLPVELPARLKQLIPYQLALDIRCAPVGRDHNRLTVAMADPTNRNAVLHLKETTGMIIFPVSCELAALDAAPQLPALTAEETWSSCPLRLLAWSLESRPEPPPQAATSSATANPSPPARMARDSWRIRSRTLEAGIVGVRLGTYCP